MTDLAKCTHLPPVAQCQCHGLLCADCLDALHPVTGDADTDDADLELDSASQEVAEALMQNYGLDAGGNSTTAFCIAKAYRLGHQDGRKGAR